ncbi:hypothetical protein EJ110_NYTH20108 [Nymphaea thermarum]|nr:hypothetical protein EJ110_NYTH20108 [Nymphaea thermarum]
MAAEMTPKIDVAVDTGSNTKSENVPVQVTSIRLNKDNYLSWSAALEIGITSRGRLPYIIGEKPAPSKTNPTWATWAFEDSQVKGDLSVASFYAALKTKWKELDYHVNDDWNCGSDHALYWQKEWMDRTFIFLGGRDEFESIRSQILNCNETPEIEEVYAQVESEEQCRQGLGSVLFGVVVIVTSWGILLISVGIFILRRGSPVVVLLLVGEVLLCPTLVMVALQVLKNQSFPLTKSRNCKLISAGYPLLKRTPPRLRVYTRKKKDVVEDVDVTNPNPVSSPNEPSPMNEELPMALRKGTSASDLLQGHPFLGVLALPLRHSRRHLSNLRGTNESQQSIPGYHGWIKGGQHRQQTGLVWMSYTFGVDACEEDNEDAETSHKALTRSPL